MGFGGLPHDLEQFIEHVDQLLSDDRLRIDTTRGRRPISSMIRDISRSDRGVELKRLMSELGKPDRALEAQMPVGEYVDVVLSHRKWRLFKATVGKLHVACISPTRALIQGISNGRKRRPNPFVAGNLLPSRR